MLAPLPNATAALTVGALVGLHVASWGMYKDALYEGFCPRKYARSILVGALAALGLQLSLHFALDTAAGVLLLFGTAYALERGLVESWKAFLRNEDQGKYFIPMTFAVLGRPVADRRLRRLAGLVYVVGVVGVVATLAALGTPNGARPPLWLLLAVGTTGGWISAFGGAWKDAPKEGFQLLKFFRSPGMALGYAALLSQLTGSFTVVAFGALGLTIATIETHKKFDRPRQAPGKFSGKPVLHPEMYRLRRAVVPVYAAIWVWLVATMAASLAEAGVVESWRAFVEVARG